MKHIFQGLGAFRLEIHQITDPQDLPVENAILNGILWPRGISLVVKQASIFHVVIGPLALTDWPDEPQQYQV